jgi:hypothetical protein
MNWKKIGHIFNTTEVKNISWMKEFAQCTSALVFDDFVRVYFSCRPNRDKDGQYLSYTGFVELDRNDLAKIINISKEPILPLGGLGCFDEFAIYPTSVIKYNDIFLLYYTGWTRCKSTPFNCSIGLAYSDDGIKFTRHGRGPILSFSKDEPYVISGPKIRRFNNKWYLFYLGGIDWIMYENKPESIYKLKMATSEDGIDWKIENRNIVNDVLDENECQAGPDVFCFEGRYNMYFSYRHGLDFRNKERGYRVGYAYSYDLLNWTRDDDNVGIHLSKEGWDSEMMHYPHVFQCDEKMYMTYNGNEFGRYGFGLAELEK